MRDYEISLWTQEDEFIEVLGASGSYYANKMYNPILTLSLDAIDTLTFNIPIIYKRNDNNNIINNRDWYENLISSGKLANERKIKLIFNKDSAFTGENKHSIYEFVIQSFTEKRNDKEVYCEISCNGLANVDLAKNGVNLILDSDTILAEESETNTTITPTLDYWANKIFPKTDNVWTTGWGYLVQMDYSYDIIAGKVSTKCYETDNIIGYDEDGNPLYNTTPIEKARFLSIKDSNRYNITQDIAETFGVYVKYVYGYDDTSNPFKITSKTVVFYNSLIQDSNFTISYGNNQRGISKVAVSDDIRTKIYVANLENEDSVNGFSSIADAPSNYTKDNFILNFGYYIEKGQLNEERQELIPTFETNIRALNTQLAETLNDKYAKQNEILSLEVQQKTLEDQIAAAATMINDSTDKINAIGANLTTQVLTETKVAFIVKKLDDNNNMISFTRNGILNDATFTILKSTGDSLTTFNKNYNQYGFVTSITFSNTLATTGAMLYATYHYDVLSYYRYILNTYQTAYDLYRDKHETITTQLILSNDELDTIETNYASLFNQKKELIATFDKKMGYFLKEGTWTPSSYSSPSENKAERVALTNDFLDSIALSGEQLSYYMVGMTQTYYNYIIADTFLSANNIKNFTVYKKNSILGTKNIYIVGAHFTIEYYKLGENFHKVLLFNKDVVLNANGEDKFYYIDQTGNEIEITSYFQNALIDETKRGVINYLRYIINETNAYESSVQININSSEVLLDSDPQLITLYYDYNITSNSSGQKVITFKNMNLNLPVLPFYMDISYKCDRTVDQLYYDALDVAKTAAYPASSYEIDFVELKNSLNRDFSFPMDASHAYLSDDANSRVILTLGTIVRVNDTLLHLANIKGLINKLTLSLENPANDKITIQNYKSKFADLFSKIVKSSETLQNNLLGYNRAATAILPTGEINVSLLQNAIDRNNLILRSGIKSGVTQDENGILIKNLSPYANGAYGMVALRGGGMFLSDSEDSSGAPVFLSAITPKGINANLITAGRIDTEKINIYSGDQIRFTWKADGLFAYKQLGNGAIDYTTYVKYSEDGLALSEYNGSEQVARVEVGWNGFRLRNSANTIVFDANPEEGDLSIAGSLYLPSSSSAFIGTKEFANGALGTGWRISGDGNAEFNNLTMRGKISASVFEYDKVSSVGGDLYISPTIALSPAGAISIVNSKYVFTFTNPYGSSLINGLTWNASDVVMLQGFITTTAGAYEIRKLLCIITTIDTNSIVLTTINDTGDIFSYDENGASQIITYTINDVLQPEATLLYYGQFADNTVSRRGIYLTSGNTSGPYIDIYDLNSAPPKIRLGDLTGIIDPVLQVNPSGYGLYAQNVFLRGDIYANRGAIGSYLTLGENGISLRDPNNIDTILTFGYHGDQFGIGYSQDGGVTWSSSIGFTGTILGSADAALLGAHSTQIQYLADGIAQRVTLDAFSNALDEKADASSVDTRFSSVIAQTATNITNTFNITQGNINALTGQFDDYKTQVAVYQRFSNDGYMELGRTDSPFVMRLSNEKLAFIQSGTEIAYFSNNKLNVSEIETPTATIANFQWIASAAGTGLKWRG